jgi:hypothetical protein
VPETPLKMLGAGKKQKQLVFDRGALGLRLCLRLILGYLQELKIAYSCMTNSSKSTIYFGDKPWTYPSRLAEPARDFLARCSEGN